MAGTITFQCYSCNQVLKVGSDKAGKKAKCIKCGTILTIPVESDEEEVEEVRAGPPRKSSARDDDDDDRPRKRGRDDDDDDDDRPRSRRSRDDDDDDDDRPRKRRSRDDDDDDDRPRSRRSRDDDDDDDRPRRRRSRDDDDEDEDYDRPRKRKGGGGGGNPWGKVRVALMLNGVSAGMLAGYAGCMLFGLIMAFVAGLAQSIGLLRFSGILLLIGFILYFALQILAVVAYVFFLFTPNKKGSFGLAITSLVLGIINLVLKLLMVLAILDAGSGGGLGGPAAMGGGFMPPIFGGGGSRAVAIMLMILVLLLLDSEWIVVPLYLRATSQIVKDRYSEGGAMQAMGFGCAAIGAQLVAILLSLAATNRAMIYILFFLQLVAFGILLAFAIIYMKVNLGLRNNVD